ncbi:hypothetical protein [Paraburkholderia rhizosphaerae]|uniref:hypothetical protein n=1 Tax=Paraburkholderia rhizosphaerae TaxID=480658 RepID=UPI001066A6D2|nr:hypothetical protein [Paraburkholderia rhizosphaerae]
MLIIRSSSGNSRGHAHVANKTSQTSAANRRCKDVSKTLQRRLKKVRHKNIDSFSERIEALSEAAGRLVKDAASRPSKRRPVPGERNATDDLETDERLGRYDCGNAIFLLIKNCSDRYLI